MYDFFFHTRTQEPYAFLLERREWKAKRDHILIRDGHCCQRCGAREEDGSLMQVHHKHYIYGLDPWEYKDSELVTLCEGCHQIVHETEKVPVYRLHEGFLEEVTLTRCYRCSGAGYFREYKHVQGGICFRCRGDRYEEMITVTENYAKEHNIDISDIQAGFRPMSDATKSRIMAAVVTPSIKKPGCLYVALSLNDGEMIHAFPDFSMECKSGDSLVVDSLLYKRKQYKNSDKSYLVLKGTIKRPDAY